MKPRALEQEKIAGEILLHHAATLAPGDGGDRAGRLHGSFYCEEKLR